MTSAEKCFSNSTKATYEIQDKKCFLVDKSVVHSWEIKIKGEIPDLYVESGLTNDKILLEGIQK
jgi:membrane fusion protein (multidrug efflux system)